MADTETDAVVNLARLKDELDAIREKVTGMEIVPQGANAAKCKPGTVAELIPGYLKAADVLPPTRVEYASRLRWLTIHFGSVAVVDLDADEVSASSRAEPWSANTRRQTLTVCQQFIRWCGRAEFKLKMPAMESRGDEAVINRDEYTSLLAVARGDFRPLLRFLWLTGCRPGEACRLTVEAVDWASGTATLREHKTKRKGKRRTLFLGPESLAVLSAQKHRHVTGPLFRGRWGEAFTADNVTERFARAVEAAGLRDTLSAYCLRHTFATRMLESGTPPSDVAALLGHSGTTMLERVYSHLLANTKRLREVAGRLDAAG